MDFATGIVIMAITVLIWIIILLRKGYSLKSGAATNATGNK